MVICPDCGEEAELIGPISATSIFAGRSLKKPLAGGYLYRCCDCSLGFRWPRLSKRQLDILYEQGNEQTWSADVDSRNDWNIAQNWIKELVPTGARILDVGCFDGGFLEPIAELFQCCGIEIHRAASKRAERKGIEIIGDDFSNVSGSFDCITAFDVIEHMESPKSFLVDCLSSVKPGGWILISTGNLDAVSFHIMGSRYWYCTIAEHISFVSPLWFSGLSRELGYRILKHARFSHGHTSVSLCIKQAINNILYRATPLGFRLLRKIGMGGLDVNTHPELVGHPPRWESARDHFMVLIQKQ